MLDIKFVRENPDLIKEAVRKKHLDFNVDELVEIDIKRLEILSLVEKLRTEQNKVTDKVAGIKDAGKREELIKEMRGLKGHLKEKEDELAEVMRKWQTLILQVPNIPDMSVPDGASDAENQEIKRDGNIPKFSFTPKDHIVLMENLDMVDFERGTKVSGFRGYFLKNDGALISFAIWQFVMNEMVKSGFSPMIVPSLVKKETLFGTGYLPQGEEDLYKAGDADYLAGTGEVGTMGYFMDEILDKNSLPKKFISFSPCFRREAGSHGKDTKGLVRVHEFFKLEQVILCEANHEESVKFHEELTRNAENLMKALKLPYRTVANCGGDLGLGQVKKYDIEAWVPSEEKYRETHSSSYFHDFQTRRLNIRYKDSDGKVRFAHSLNNTAIATPRLLVAIVENYQEEDGSIRVPEVLIPYMGKSVIKK
ncbi:MAG: serine--tRNA ligase [Candidatus Lloydbacteria bacterium RIFCSPHIGHO2_01_FULL_41_20]|uniref:Serine--tRNA ligase n=1 Tax=Candidatus Lloydbacteria bacterium RIFCSPHIGHO2_01_FULL_41_20 TaxID=1798657 RepID=A0A1G2CTM0_9BACT|nr:MAG: serine--tRNA ligase [Candidatus Lloydbacteria bacterium RIFCSPHIGHO2_01_FULL_41_20]